MTTMATQSVDVLYVEDDDADVDFAQTAFKEVGADRLSLHVVTDGEAAARYLNLDKRGWSGPQKRPDVILLDLNIPRLHGKELLRLIKRSDHLKNIPVVVLSTSNYQRDVDETYALGAAGYFIKPPGYREYKGVFETIYRYWIEKVALPSKYDPMSAAES